MMNYMNLKQTQGGGQCL